MADYLHLAAFWDLEETRRGAARLGVNIYQLGCCGCSLRRILSRLLRLALQLGHLLGAEQLEGIGPPFNPTGRSDFDEPALIIDDIQTFAVPDSGRARRLGIEILMKQQSGRTDVGLTHSGRPVLLSAARNQKNEAD